MFGTYLANALSTSGGSRPLRRLIIPDGILLRNASHLKFSARYWTLERAPTMPTGMDQNAIVAITRVRATPLCDMRRAGARFKLAQTTSLGVVPTKRGVRERTSADAICWYARWAAGCVRNSTKTAAAPPRLSAVSFDSRAFSISSSFSLIA